MMTYRFLSGDDTAEFCRRVTEALAEGWILYGPPVYAFDAARGVMRCGQAVTREEKPEGRPGLLPAAE